MLLKDAESNALDLRAIGAAVVSLRHHTVHVVAVLVLVVLLECVIRLAILLRLFISIFTFRRYRVADVTSGGNVMMFLLVFRAAEMLHWL